jgi:hypothetical protein
MVFRHIDRYAVSSPTRHRPLQGRQIMQSETRLRTYLGLRQSAQVFVDRLEQFAACADWAKARIVD